MRTILLVAFLSFFAIALVTCRKPDTEPEPPAVCHYDSSVEEMKKWYYFKTATWWVYQEQTTGALDTITVYYDWEGFNTSGTEGFETWCTSSYDGYIQYYSFNDSYSIHCLTSEECLCHKVERARARPGEFVGAGWLFLYPLIEGNYTYLVGYPNGEWTPGTSTLISTDLIYSHEDIELMDVVRWEISADQSIGGWPSVYQWAKNIGIVQIEFPHSNEDWKLIEYNVIQ